MDEEGWFSDKHATFSRKKSTQVFFALFQQSILPYGLDESFYSSTVRKKRKKKGKNKKKPTTDPKSIGNLEGRLRSEEGTRRDRGCGWGRVATRR